MFKQLVNFCGIFPLLNNSSSLGINFVDKGSFTHAYFLGENVYDFVLRLCHPYLPWPPWAAQH
jgi:hypothetical protein